METILKTLGVMSLTASIMAAAVLALRAALGRRMHPVLLSLLWGLVLLRLLTPVTFDSPVTLADWLEAPTAVTETVGDRPPDISPFQPLDSADSSDSAGESPAAAGNAAAAEPADARSTLFQAVLMRLRGISPWTLLGAVWAVGALAVLAVTLLRVTRFRRRLRLCRRVDDGPLFDRVERCRRELGIGRPVTILVCGCVRAPAVFGCLRPRLLLPADFADDMERGGLQGILLHELCHILRRDILKGYGWMAARMVHWFNPLVWLAGRMAQDDREMGCDRQALRHLGEGQVLAYGQCLIDTARRARRCVLPVPGASLLAERSSALRRRILTLTRPRSRSAPAAAAALLTAALLIIAGFTTACQMTPSRTIVGDKGETLQRILDSDADGGYPALRQALQGTHVREEAGGGNEQVTIVIDADILMPETDKIPVVKAVPRAYTQQEINRVMEVLTGGAAFYNPNLPLTKAEIEELILKMKQNKAESAALEAAGQGERDNGASVMPQDQIDKIIENYEAMLADAPEEKDYVPIDHSKLASVQAYNFYGVADPVGENYQKIAISYDSYNGGEITYYNPSFLMHSYDRFIDEIPQGLTLSPDEAKAAAKQLVGDLGIEGMEVAMVAAGESHGSSDSPLVDRDQLIPFYQVIFTRTLDGVYSNYDCRYFIIGETDEEGTSINAWAGYYERIHVFVGEGGILAFEWYCPMEITGTLNGDVGLLPFDNILDIAKKQIAIENAYWEDERIDAFRATVDTIQLGLMRVQVAGESGAYMLVPVWDFLGSFSLHYNDPPASYGADDDGWMTNDNNTLSILTINAVDGTIIDRDLGY